jgi:hypothetical protein
MKKETMKIPRLSMNEMMTDTGRVRRKVKRMEEITIMNMKERIIEIGVFF